MIPRRIRGANVDFGKPPNWNEKRDGICTTLSVRVVKDSIATMRCESAWEPTPEELAALNAGASVILSVVGGQPPVWVSVEKAEDET